MSTEPNATAARTGGVEQSAALRDQLAVESRDTLELLLEADVNAGRIAWHREYDDPSEWPSSTDNFFFGDADPTAVI